MTGIADALVGGDLLQGLMLIVARLKVLTEVSDPDSAGGAVARHHDTVVVGDVVLTSRRDREPAARDHSQARKRGQLFRDRSPSSAEDEDARR